MKLTRNILGKIICFILRFTYYESFVKDSYYRIAITDIHDITI